MQDDDAESNGNPEEMDEFSDDELDEHDGLKHDRKLVTGDVFPVNAGLC